MNPEIKQMLEAKLDGANVKQRDKGKFKLSYVEGWHAIAEANRIFGFDGWSRETVYCREVCRYEKESYGKINQVVGYEAKVLISALGVVREGTGHGNGQMPDLFDAIESASKEAETDAMKRALMTFGNPFGLALYDKTQANVEKEESKIFPNAAKRKDWESKLADLMRNAVDKAELRGIWEDNQDMLTKLKNSPADYENQSYIYLEQVKDQSKTALTKAENQFREGDDDYRDSVEKD